MQGIKRERTSESVNTGQDFESPETQKLRSAGMSSLSVTFDPKVQKTEEDHKKTPE